MTQGNEWTAAQFTAVSDYCDLSAYFGGPSNCVSYAFTRIMADEAQTAYLRFGSDDGIKIWLNGIVVYNNASTGGWSNVETMVSINLNAGVNRLLLKLKNDGGGYGFSLYTTEGSDNLGGDTPVGIEYKVTAAGAPEVVLNSPVNGALIADTRVDFVATVSDDDGDPMTVWCYADENPDPTTPIYMREGVPDGTQLTIPWGDGQLHDLSSAVGLWHLDENSGVTAYDATGYNNHGTFVNADWATGKFGSCVYLDNDADYVEIPDSPELNPTDALTAEAWIYIDHYNATQKIMCKPYWPAPQFDPPWCSFLMSLTSPDLVELTVAVDQGGTVNDYIIVGYNSVSLNEWHYICGTYDGLTGIHRIYIDGVLDRETNIGPGTLISTEHSLLIGSPYVGNTTMDWEGWIDEARVLDRALSPEEVARNYGLGEGRYYWKVAADDGIETLITSETRYFDIGEPGPNLSPDITERHR